ncbi:MAG: hypothetical protein AB1847_03050 [bacterium]
MGNILSSLRPYLETQKVPFSIQFAPIGEDSQGRLENTSFPFRIIGDAEPFTRLIEARLLTGAESEIKRVFLLIQKDDYSLSGDILKIQKQLNNRDIDDAWQNAFSETRRNKGDGSVMILAHQIHLQEKKEWLVPFQPLFYCRYKHLFFDPLCPGCGRPLQQCYDDDLLIRSGLWPYSTSLRRYVYCPACAAASSEECNFYTFALESSDPPHLMDRRDLIRRFGHLLEDKIRPGQLLEDEIHPGQFPCIECTEKKECYGRDSRCLSRVLPFAFYSFFMLVFDAMSLHALDFLALVSGASFEERESGLTDGLESGRAQCLKAIRQRYPAQRFTFYNQGERHFYEVLYLKLSFLGEFLQTALPAFALDRQPERNFSLDRTWVRLAGKSSFLPPFWSFSVGTIDLGINGINGINSINGISHLGTSPFSRIPQISSLSSLGLVWFSTFLVNQKQDAALVFKAMDEAVSASSGFCEHQSGFDLAQRNQTFMPENIFWNPERGAIPENGRIFWERCLSLGWSLLHAGCHASSRWSKEAFWEQFKALQEEVKDAFLQGKEDVGDCLRLSGMDKNTENSHLETKSLLHDPGENKAIRDLLTKVLNQWRAEIDEKQDISTELEETVMISSENMMENTFSQAANSHTIPAGAEEDKEDDNDIPETVIISPQDRGAPGVRRIPWAGGKAKEAEKPAPAPEPESVSEPAPEPEPVSESEPDSECDDFLTETVILSSNEDYRKKDSP